MARTRAHLATLLLAAALSHCSLVQGSGARSANRYEFTRPLMGTTMRIVMYAPDAGAAQGAAAAAFGRIAELDAELSDYRDSSELMRLSRQAGSGPVRVSDDLFRVLRAAQQLFRRIPFDALLQPHRQVSHQQRFHERARIPEPRLRIFRPPVLEKYVGFSCEVSIVRTWALCRGCVRL